MEGGGFTRSTCDFPLQIHYSVVSLPPMSPRGFEFAQHASETTQLIDASPQRAPTLPSGPPSSNHLIRLSPSHSHLTMGFTLLELAQHASETTQLVEGEVDPRSWANPVRMYAMQGTLAYMNPPSSPSLSKASLTTAFDLPTSFRLPSLTPHPKPL